MTWIGNNAVEGGSYAITASANETIAPKTLSYSGKNVSVTINGGTAERTVSLSTTGSLFTVGSGVTLTLGNNVTLQGRSGNTASLITVNSGGKLVMNSGSKVGGNTSSDSGGGVFVGSESLFIKQSSGVIYGSNASGSLKNTATSGDSYGHAVYVDTSPDKKRNTTAGSGVTLNSGVSGSSGGWEGTVSNITYSSVSGGTWTLLNDGRRKSPAIDHNTTTKSRVSFTSAIANASITIQLEVSSEAGYDCAFISELDNANATYNSNATNNSGYYPDSVISGSVTKTVTIPVPTAGSHFIPLWV